MWVLISMVAVFIALAIVVFVVKPFVFVVKPWDDTLAQMGMFLCGVLLPLALISIPVYRANTRDHLAQRDALQQSYNDLRTNPLEMVTVGKEIAKWNGWLASAKYWNGTQWQWWWPDAVKQTKPIR